MQISFANHANFKVKMTMVVEYFLGVKKIRDLLHQVNSQ